MITITKRKVRADAKLEQLSEEQQERLRGWLEEMSYANVVERVRREFGLSVGRSAVGVYYRRHVLSVQQEEEAEVVAGLAALPPSDFDQATLQRAKVLLWTALARPEPEVELAVKLSGIIARAERQALAVRKLELEERKVAVREKLAEVKTTEGAEVARESREGARMPRQELEPRNTRNDTKGADGSEGSAELAMETEGSAGVVGQCEGTEMAAKALSREGRSEGADGANLPRGAGYVGLMRTEAETEVARELARIQRQDLEPRNTRNDTKGSEGSEEVAVETEESAGVVGRCEGAEMAAMALSREGRSAGAEGAGLAEVLPFSALASGRNGRGVRDRAA